jgi:hypothetical protein
MEGCLLKVSTLLAGLFLTVLSTIVLCNANMFLKRHGRRHALTGLLYLLWTLFGFYSFVVKENFVSYAVYDVVLGVLGVWLALSAAFDFQHKNVVNVASGTLDEHATVTYGEMIEHSFYQGVNLVQILFLHVSDRANSRAAKICFAFLVTCPWLFRPLFPINRFSDNYRKVDSKSTNFIRTMYRIKKYQYVFYKHFLLHGLNLSALLYGYMLPSRREFRIFWMLLNISYVMEFFMQTLVKKKYISQAFMLQLQLLLMTAASVAALFVLQHVDIGIAMLSLVLNFTHRNHEMFNTLLVLLLWMTH